MIFQGLRDYSTQDPAKLRQDLQRQNIAVEQALQSLVRESAGRPVARSVTKDSLAAIGEVLLVDPSAADVTVQLPPSSPDAAWRVVTVCRVAIGNVLRVRAAGKDRIAASSTFDAEAILSGSLGFTAYADDGRGTWWRSR